MKNKGKLCWRKWQRTSLILFAGKYNQVPQVAEWRSSAVTHPGGNVHDVTYQPSNANLKTWAQKPTVIRAVPMLAQVLAVKATGLAWPGSLTVPRRLAGSSVRGPHPAPGPWRGGQRPGIPHLPLPTSKAPAIPGG